MSIYDGPMPPADWRENVAELNDEQSGTPTQEDTITVLMRFYGVKSIEALVEAQADHIVRLQAKLPKYRDAFPRTPREG